MSDGGDYDDETSRRTYRGPYTSHHPIPTIQRYLQRKDQIDQHLQEATDSQKDEIDESRVKRAFDSVKQIVTGEDREHLAGDPYPTVNYNSKATGEAHERRERQEGQNGNVAGFSAEQEQQQDTNGSSGRRGEGGQDTAKLLEMVVPSAQSDPRHTQARTDGDPDDGGREVTDPVTHLPIVVRDSTVKDLKRAPENEAAPGTETRTSTGLNGASKSSDELDSEQKELQKNFEGMQKTFPPPNFDDAKVQLARIYSAALLIGLGSTIILATLVITMWRMLAVRRPRMPETGVWSKQKEESTNMYIPLSITAGIAIICGGALVWAIQGWLNRKVKEIWDDAVWGASREHEREILEHSDAHMPESAAWLNSLLASCWPLINPDLFASLADELEDVMQASLPKLVRMVSVEDLGQGSEAIRILGVRCLPTGAASLTVDAKGRLKLPKGDPHNDRNTDADGQAENAGQDNDADSDNSEEGDRPDGKPKRTKKSKNPKKNEQQEQQEQEDRRAISEGMEAEQGDFINLELAFAYRARASGNSVKKRSKNAHLYLRFYFPGGIFFPVWVELKGLVGTMRLRVQLMPDPPFVGLCTLTFLGQPRANLSCVPLNQRLLNIMNLPLISSFVQTSVDAALAEYVAPKSLTLNLKEMLAGDDFKKDTTARGVVVVFIKSARGFKEGDTGIGPIKGSSDPYVTVSWGKYGKPMASTRIIINDLEPNWSEWAYVLCGPEEINAEENLRLQLWDSDKFTADDDLGRVEVNLKELMHGTNTRNQMCEREDRLCGEEEDETMPGILQWSVGYFAKAPISDEQLERQSKDNRIKTRDDLKRVIKESAAQKLREATKTEENKEIRHQEIAEYKEREDDMIISQPPSRERPSGILSIHIHNITGLELELQNKRTHKEEGDREDESEESDDLPSSYATIILNHRKVYRTRTKPKNAKPFFNACTERFIRDWQTTEVMISFRDSRERENDPLLGIVYLPLSKVFRKQSQSMDTLPLAGGIGYGRARISMVFRSVEMQLPKELLGWDYGTLEIKLPVRSRGQLPENLNSYRLKLRTSLSRIKVHPDATEWNSKKGNNGFLAVRKRYCAPLIAEWRSSNVLKDRTVAFAVMWFKDIPDEEETTVLMQVWKGSKQGLKKATTCCDYAGIEENEKPLGEIEVTMILWRGLSQYHKRYARKGKEHDMSQVMEVLDTVNDEREQHVQRYEHVDNYDDDDDDDADDDTDNDDSDNGSEDENEDDDELGPSRTRRSAAHDPDSVQQQHDDLSTKDKLKKLFHPHQHHSTEQHEADGEPEDDHEVSNPPSNLKSTISTSPNDNSSTSADPSPNPPSGGLLNEIRDYKDNHAQLHRKNRGVMQFKGARTADWVATKIRHGKDRLSGVFEHGERGPGVETEV